jgi:cation:H+ antiporter
MSVKPFVAAAARAGSVGAALLSALWTFPSMLLSAFLVAWGAEAAQVFVSQGLALAVLAWLQTMPEFAVEAVIAWDAGKYPATAHLAIANLTGAIRLLIGVGWPMIYFVSAYAGRRTRGRLPDIELDREHAISIVGLLPPLLWFVVIWWKKSLGAADAVVLLVMYAAYLWILMQSPPKSEEALEEMPRVARWAGGLGGWRSGLAIGGLFVAGGVLLYITAHPFVNTMLALATALGVSQFVFVQWLAPFLSEFPEGVSCFTWAKRVTRAPMALMNLVSSNVNQWTVLAAMIPLLYGWSHHQAHGTWATFTLDAEQQVEIGLTVAQSILASLLLMNLRFTWLDASALFLLWLVQFLAPGVRIELTLAYLAWCLWQVGLFVTKKQELLAPRVLVEVLRDNRRRSRNP